jgi:DNA-binding response OmpR family regulator
MKSKSILLVEDEALIGFLFVANLESAGFDVVGPCLNVNEAFDALETEEIGAAFLDVNLGGGETSAPIAHALTEQGIPFYFLTGYAASAPGKSGYPADRYLSKPIDEEHLVAAAKELLAS